MNSNNLRSGNRADGTTPLFSPDRNAEVLIHRAGDGAERVIARGRSAADHALEALSGGVDSFHSGATDLIGRLTARGETAMRHTRERARDASALVRQRVDLAGQRTVSTIQAEPLKAVIIAAAAGAIVAGIIALLAARPRRRDSARDTMQ